MGADCKSVAKATEVRILYLPRKAPGIRAGGCFRISEHDHRLINPDGKPDFVKSSGFVRVPAMTISHVRDTLKGHVAGDVPLRRPELASPVDVGG